jgi:hypothetical protein
MVRRFIFMFKMNKAIIELGRKKNIYLSERQMIKQNHFCENKNDFASGFLFDWHSLAFSMERVKQTCLD